MLPDTFDPLDRQIVHALQLQALAPFSTIAAVLGVSDQTVARRYSRLRANGALRVRGLTEPYLDGRVPWLLRLRCPPAATARVARAVAQRDDTAWVRLTSGGAEIVCMVTGTADDEDTLLLDRLPNTPQVESVTAHHLLRTFSRGLHVMLAEHSGLTDEQVQALRPPSPSFECPTELGAKDRRLLQTLAQDARTAPRQLAALTHWSHSTVRRRITELTKAGVLYFDVDIDPRVYPEARSWSLLWLSVEPASLEKVGNALATHAQVGFVAATTGPTNLYASVTGAAPTALYSYLTQHIAPLQGIRSLETAPVLRRVKSNV